MVEVHLYMHAEFIMCPQEIQDAVQGYFAHNKQRPPRTVQ